VCVTVKIQSCNYAWREYIWKAVTVTMVIKSPTLREGVRPPDNEAVGVSCCMLKFRAVAAEADVLHTRLRV